MLNPVKSCWVIMLIILSHGGSFHPSGCKVLSNKLFIYLSHVGSLFRVESYIGSF